MVINTAILNRGKERLAQASTLQCGVINTAILNRGRGQFYTGCSSIAMNTSIHAKRGRGTFYAGINATVWL